MTANDGTILSLDEVRFGFPTRPNFLGPINVSLSPGDLLAVVGPNGSGKSTLLRIMAGLLASHGGSTKIEGKEISAFSARERAQLIAFLPQQIPSESDIAARDVVRMGRYPYRSLGMFESAEDDRIVSAAMDATATLDLAGRRLETLSGGEAQRVHLSAAIAQHPKIMLLDEPTASLDVQHQLAVFHILSELVRRDRLAIVVVTHDVNLAARFCSHVLLLDDGKAVASGPPEKVITPKVLRDVFGVDLVTLTDDSSGLRWVVPVDESSAVSS